MRARKYKGAGVLLVAGLIGVVPVFLAGTAWADPPPAKQPVPKLVGSTWRMEYAVLPAMIERWTFAADGTVSVEDLACQQKAGAPEKWVPSRDTFDWVQNGSAISIVMNSRIDGRNFSRFIGTIEGDEIKGRMVNNFGLDTQWTLKRVKVR